jgi:carboxyl-terminal processing protease
MIDRIDEQSDDSTQDAEESAPRASRAAEPGVTRRAISFAAVAVVAFLLGIAVEAKGTGTLSNIPLIGDGLNATPDQSADLADFWKAWNALNQNYVITHASSTLPENKDKIFGAIAGLAASYGDPYTVFFPPEQAKQFNDQISGTFAGIGLEIDNDKDGNIVVIAPLKDTPAEAAGFKTGDVILSVNGTSTEGMTVDEAVSDIRGKKGTTVTLVVSRDGTALTIPVVRDTIQVPETDDSLDKDSGVYTIALYEFSANSAQLFDAAFNRFKASGSKKLIIDLRGNPGGYLDAAVHIASHFLPKGTTIVTEDYEGKQENDVHTSSGIGDEPAGTQVVVLIDGGSASASEILSGALKDNNAATLIGAKSFGKGSVQQLIDIDGGSLKVTVARWLTPSGLSIMGNGITPDIVVQESQDDAAKGIDDQKQRAIQFLTTGK